MPATPLISLVDSRTSEIIPPLLGASVTELTAWVQQQGQPAYRGKQLHEWIYQKGVRSLADISVFSKQWRARSCRNPHWTFNYTPSRCCTRWHDQVPAATG